MISTITGVELEKIARRKFSVLFLFLLICIQMILIIAGYKIRIKNMQLGTGFQVSAFSIQFVLQIMTLIVLAMASISISGEMSSGTIKTVLARNIKRRDLIIGKFAALLISGIAALVLIYLLALGAGHFTGGLVPLKDGDYLLCSTGKLTGGYFASLILFIPPLVALISFGVFISVLIRGAGGAVGTGIISFLVLQMLSQLDSIDNYLFTHYLTLPMEHYYKLTEGIILNQTSAIFWNIGISTVYTIVFLSLSIFIFCKKDIWR